MTRAVDCAHSIEGEGPPLILVHGIGAARDTWRFLMPHLTRHFQVITYDLRGHGASPCPDLPFDLEDLVADLEQLRKTLGLARCHIAGHSLGGMIGPAYARLHPDRVLSLGLLSTAAFRTQDDSEKVWAVVKAMEAKGVPAVLQTLIDRWYTDAFIDTHRDIVDRRLKQVVDTDPEVFLNVFRIYAGTEMAPWISEVGTRSLILTGEKDGGCNPRLNQQIHDAMPNSELVILPDYKHSILLEAGEIVARHLTDFIQADPRPA
ncbi:MAG: alpha/beta hydrolase [Pseudomonadota bacterium]